MCAAMTCIICYDEQELGETELACSQYMIGNGEQLCRLFHGHIGRVPFAANGQQ